MITVELENERIKRLRERYQNDVPKISIERARFFTEKWFELEKNDEISIGERIALSMNAGVYLVGGLIGLFAILVSWLRGLFYYVTITPNYMNLQEGPTESGEQIGREDYNSRIDTSDFLERLMGFGRIVITFREDRKRDPIVVLVWQIQKKAQLLERVRGKLAIDQHASLT